MDDGKKWERFDRSVVTTSRRTMVNTDQLVLASQQLRGIKGDVENSGNMINVLTMMSAAVAYVPCGHAPAITDAISRATCHLHTLKDQMQQLLDRLNIAALVYAAAEEDARTFNYLRATFYGEASVPHYMMIDPFQNLICGTASFMGLVGSKLGLSSNKDFMSAFLEAIKERELSAHAPSLHLRLKMRELFNFTFVPYLLYSGKGVKDAEKGEKVWWGNVDSISQKIFSELSGGVDGLAQSTQPHKNVQVIRREMSSDIATPILAYSAIERLGKLDNTKDHGLIEIQHHRSVDADKKVRNSYSVMVPGTQDWLNTGASPNDLQTNVRAAAMLKSDQTEAIEKAMEQQEIKPGDPVEFIGHSQGGIVISQMLSQPSFQKKYNVVAAVTAGSPIGNARPSLHANIMSLENSKDIVPALDGTPNRDLGNARTVTFNGDALDDITQSGNKRDPHDVLVYSDAMKRFEDQPSKFDAEIREWSEERRKKMEFNDGTTTTAYQYDTYQDIDKK